MAVLDIGSYSVLLLVAERGEGGWVRLYEECAITRLAEGLALSGELTTQAMERTLEACRRLLHTARSFEPEPLLAVGTMALREASNAPRFIEALSNVSVDVRILSGEEEARYSYLAVARDPTFGRMARDGGLVVVDVGGGSTEIVRAEAASSLAIGASTLAEGFLGFGPCPQELVLAACEAADVLFREAAGDAGGAICTVGATGVNLACVARALPFDPDAVHGARLPTATVVELRHRLCSMSPEDRAQLPGLEAGRETVIHAGALILERALMALGAEEVGISSRGLRWGLLEEPVPA